MIYRACFCKKKQSLWRCGDALHGTPNCAFTVASEIPNSDSDYFVPPQDDFGPSHKPQ
jgi:hypothetical protein